MIEPLRSFAVIPDADMDKCEFRLDERARAYAETFLNETEVNRAESLRQLRDWLHENPNIGAKTDDLSLLAFLRGCKFDLDRTRRKIREYYKMRAEVPEWFGNRDPGRPEILELLKLGVFVPLDKLHDNRHVVIIRTAAHDPKKHSQDDVFKVGKMILDVLAAENELLQIYGVVAIFDMKNVSLAHARQLPPARIKKAVNAWQNYHCRPKQLEFVNAPVYVNVLLNVFKSFMSKKLRGRVRVHFGGLETLREEMGEGILPAEYGGTGGPIQDRIDFWLEKLQRHKEWFAHDERFKTQL